MQDKIVFDIETKNFFTDPGVGRDNFAALEVSAIGIYSYIKDKYFCFLEDEPERAAEFFRNAELIIGFSINIYDIPVLVHYFERYFAANPKAEKFDIQKIYKLDLQSEMEMSCGFRPSLNSVSLANLGIGKSGKSDEAGELYRNGKLEELKAYCLQDVRLTKDLYDLSVKQRYLLVPQRNEEHPIKCEFEYL